MTLAQPTPIPVHDVVRQRVHDVMRSCVLDVMRQDTRSREIGCHRRGEIRCPRCAEITHQVPRTEVPNTQTSSSNWCYLPEPTCSSFLAPRFSEKTTWTAIAPEAVLTVRTYGLTPAESTGHPHATRSVRKNWLPRSYRCRQTRHDDLDHAGLSQVGKHCERNAELNEGPIIMPKNHTESITRM